MIFSRKGFDSASGGCPSPIFSDGAMLALPIPDRLAPVRYDELTIEGRNLGELVPRLTGGKVKPHYRAHLDPDLRFEALPRPQGWRPLFGQRGAAQGHLRKQGVCAGDVFVFWGLFRQVDSDLAWRGPPMHAVWGWMEVADVIPADEASAWRGHEWLGAASHPHLGCRPDATNTLYAAARRLSGNPGLPGAGVFTRYSDALRLTDSGAKSVSLWSLPRWLHPRKRRPLSYHSDLRRWSLSQGRALLQTVGRGQEFVLDAEDYPEARPWLNALLGSAMRVRGGAQGRPSACAC